MLQLNYGIIGLIKYIYKNNLKLIKNKDMKNQIFFFSLLISLVSTFSVLIASEENLSTDYYIVESIVSFLVTFILSFFGLRYYEKKKAHNKVS